MTMQPYPRNPIELRKQAVRRHAKNGVIAVSGGVIGGAALAFLTGSSFFLILGLIIAVVGGFSSYRRVQRIVNYKDNQ
ncbi:hypothetical protein [Corynebacterium freiburgense]|uniref:hypothetical protein n=1 Tax=Corynebacterium freiburgense TaxID=556548 RepID=UPI00047CE529|nr:hypothetical protein [Corynebacterium freiburgense]WJZ03112.1 hypothetical protein CFREI_09170 [Corynebacterium freiburgense]